MDINKNIVILIFYCFYGFCNIFSFSSNTNQPHTTIVYLSNQKKSLTKNRKTNIKTKRISQKTHT